MPYIDKNDLLTYIKLEVLNQVVEDDDTFIDATILVAQEEAASYVRPRYNVPTEFNKTAGSRCQLFMMIVCIITIYRLHMRANPVQIPLIWVNEYNGNHSETASWGGVIKTLMMVQNGNIDIDLPKISPAQNRAFEGGSNTKYSSTF